MRLIRGDKLKPEAYREALSACIYRWTWENGARLRERLPMCPVCKVAGGMPDYPPENYTAPIECRQYHPTVPLVSDADWMRAHAFSVKRDGSLDARSRYAQPAYLASDDDATKRQENDWKRSARVED